MGRYILNGYVIAEEYRMTRPTGELVLLGMNFRSYHAAMKTWVVNWLNVPASTWMDLGPEELGGIRVEGTAIT